MEQYKTEPESTDHLYRTIEIEIESWCVQFRRWLDESGKRSAVLFYYHLLNANPLTPKAMAIAAKNHKGIWPRPVEVREAFHSLTASKPPKESTRATEDAHEASKKAFWSDPRYQYKPEESETTDLKKLGLPSDFFAQLKANKTKATKEAIATLTNTFTREPGEDPPEENSDVPF